MHYDQSRDRQRDSVFAALDKKLPTFTPLDGPEITLPFIELLSIPRSLLSRAMLRASAKRLRRLSGRPSFNPPERSPARVPRSTFVPQTSPARPRRRMRLDDSRWLLPLRQAAIHSAVRSFGRWSP